MKRVVITGATSTIGIALVQECLKKQIEVLAIVREGAPKIVRLPKSDNVQVLECNLCDYKKIDTTPFIERGDGYDVMFHLAWEATGGDEARNSIRAQERNIEYSLDAVELAENLGCKVFVGAGSQAEYGRTNEVLTEETITKPETPYGMAKLCAGQMTRLSCEQRGIKHIWPRILSVYGPNCQPHTVLQYTLSELLNRRRPSLSAGEQIWDFIYTEDVARALLLLASKGQDGEVYVVGSGESRPLKEYLREVRDTIEKYTHVSDLELGLGDKKYGNSTVMHLACDNSKLKRDTGFEVEIDFQKGIENTIDWIKLNTLKE